MTGKEKNEVFDSLPTCVADFIKLVIKKMRYRKKVRLDVQAELAAHFEDELRDCKTDEEKEQKAQQLIAEFGDVKLLAVLLRRAKKRCRPLWRTIVARTFQTVGVLILCLIIYTVWFLTGKPVITTNYVAELNRIARPASDDKLNAAPFYNKAAESVEKLPNDIKELLQKKYNEVTPEQKQLMEKWLTDNSEVFELVIAGTQKPYYWQKYEAENNEVISVLWPYLADFRNLAYALRWRAQLRAEQGRYEDAFGDIKSCYRFGQHIKGDVTFLIDQLVGMAIERLAVQSLRDVLSEHGISSAALAKLQQDFEQMIAGEDFTVSLNFERLTIYDEIQRCFTEDRFGDGHLYIPRLTALSSIGMGTGGIGAGDDESFMLKLYLITLDEIKAGLRVFFTHPNKQQTMISVNEFYDYLEKLALKTPAQMRAEEIDVEKETMQFIKGNLFLETFTPSLYKVIELSYRIQIDVEATLTIIAILRYRKNIGGYPKDLDKLIVASYLKELPMDPFSDKPLVYKRTDDNFILYSVGPNFKDDGGQKGRVKKCTDEGDWVFWPVLKND